MVREGRLRDGRVVVRRRIIPLMGSTIQALPIALRIAVGKALFSVGVAIAAGLWVLPWLMGRVGGVKSRELFLLTVLVLSLGAALSTQIFGLSAVFGAFLIGLVIRKSRFVHQALGEITPLRDVFATLFFVSLGMLLDPGFLIEYWSSVLVLVGTIIVIKFLVIFSIVRLFGYGGRIAFITVAGLFQIGEFAFILAQAGINANLVSEQFYSLILSSAIITMLMTPLSIDLASRLYPKLAWALGSRTSSIKQPQTALTPEPSEAPSRVILAGSCRIGPSIAQGPQEAGTP